MLKNDIKLLVLDVDGVLTDGRLWWDAAGEEYKTFHVHDGLGLKRLQQTGVIIAVISGRHSTMTQHRLTALGIPHIFLGISDKVSCLSQLAQQLGIDYPNIAYIGDDLPDLPVMAQVGLPIAVANATEQVKQMAHWRLTRCGGDAAVREACERLLAEASSKVSPEETPSQQSIPRAHH